jgi:hypothetical protein
MTVKKIGPVTMGAGSPMKISYAIQFQDMCIKLKRQTAKTPRTPRNAEEGDNDHINIVGDQRLCRWRD